METSDVQGYVDHAVELVIEKGPKIIFAIILLLLGLMVIRRITRSTTHRLKRENVEPSIAPFFSSLISAFLKVLLVIVVATMLGVETTSFVAVIGAMTLAIGMALQGSLGNFAGGIMILIFKPFKVGDIIKAQGFEGYVEEIQVFNTTILGVDRKLHIIPNGILSNGHISNYSVKGSLRVNLKAWVGYDEDIELAKKVALEVLEAHPLVLKDPHPRVRVFELEKDAVVLGIHPYTGVMELWDVYFDVQEQIVKAFRENDIKIPRSKMDMLFDQQDGTSPSAASISSIQ